VTFEDSRSLGSDTVSPCEWVAMFQRTVKGSSSWRKFPLRLLDPEKDDTASQPSRHQEPCTPTAVSHPRRLESSATCCENFQSRRVTFIVVFITCLWKDKYFLKLLRN